MDPVDDDLLNKATDHYIAIRDRAQAAGRQRGRRRPTPIEADREWLVRYTEVLLARLLFLATKPT